MTRKSARASSQAKSLHRHSVPFFFSAGEFETDNSVLEKKFYAGTPGAQFSCGVGVTEPSTPEPYTPKSFGFCLL